MRLAALAFAALLASTSATPATASALYNFVAEYNGFQGNHVIRFSLPARAADVPGFLFGNGYFGWFSGVDGLTFNDVPSISNRIYFYQDTSGGGMLILVSSPGFFFSSYFANGPQVFSGDVSDPTFDQGEFHYFNGSDIQKLTISAAGIPEPGTWAMLIAGFGLVGAGLRVRRRDMALEGNSARTI